MSAKYEKKIIQNNKNVKK